MRPVFWWDLDKTYLATAFESLPRMIKIPFEAAEDKKTVPGAAALIREIQDCWGEAAGYYCLSASPPQIKKEILRRFELDGVRWSRIFFKDQLSHLLRGQFRHLKKQGAYKLAHLLKTAMEEGEPTVQYLFGDDWEEDPLVYTLYADILEDRVSGWEVHSILERMEALDAQKMVIYQSLRGMKARHRVVGIFIHLAKSAEPPPDAGHPRLLYTRNYFQTALALWQDGRLGQTSVLKVAEGLIRSGWDAAAVAAAGEDLVRRRALSVVFWWRVLFRFRPGPASAVRRWAATLVPLAWIRRLRARRERRRNHGGSAPYRALLQDSAPA